MASSRPQALLPGRKKAALVGMVALAVAAAAFVFLQLKFREANCNRCAGTLRSLWKAIEIYAEDYEGQFPPQLTVLTSQGYVDARFFLCSGLRSTSFILDTKEVPVPDYTYVYWPAGSQTPEGYPLIYDRLFSNHGAGGINVIRVDGVVIWDAGAEWLRRFAGENRPAGLSLPE